MAESASKVTSSDLSLTSETANPSKLTLLRPSVLRVGKSDSTSVPLETDSKPPSESESKVFKFTPLSVSSSTDNNNTTSSSSSAASNSTDLTATDLTKPKIRLGLGTIISCNSSCTNVNTKSLNGNSEEVSTSNPLLKPSSLFSSIINSGKNASSNSSAAATPSTSVSSTTSLGVSGGHCSSLKGIPSVIVGSTSVGSTSSSTAASGGSGSGSESSFVFGQNLQDRVLLPDSCNEESNDVQDKQMSSQPLLDSQTENHKENLLSSPSTSAEKRKFDQSFEAITGEEGESNVMQMYCKLYSWESSNSTWKEKGKGILRLNDKKKEEKLCSRLVMRTSGSLKVILNCVIIAGMKFELANEQCLRFTNVDGIYLIKGKDKDIERINSAIDCRLRELSKKIKTELTAAADEHESNQLNANSITTTAASSSSATTISICSNSNVNNSSTNITTAAKLNSAKEDEGSPSEKVEPVSNAGN